MTKKTLIEVGWKKLACGHIVRLPYDDTPCPVCAEIRDIREGDHQENLECLKMARKEGREEVLAWVIERCRNVSDGEEDSVEDEVRQAYRERFGEG